MGGQVAESVPEIHLLDGALGTELGRRGVDTRGALFSATVQATEEAIINALVAAETMKAPDGRVIEALPHEKLKAVLKKYGR